MCLDLIKLERKNIPGCASDGEALESIIFRAATSPEARQLITQAALKEPLYAAAQLAWELARAGGGPELTPTKPGVKPQRVRAINQLLEDHSPVESKGKSGPR